jgi:dipeptidase
MYKKTTVNIVVAASTFILLTASVFIVSTSFKQHHGLSSKSQVKTHFRDKCSSIIVGKDVTADGSVILAHNEDLSNYSAHHYVYVPRAAHEAAEIVTTFYGAEVPQVLETYAYTGTTIFDISYYPGAVTSGINEYQVAVVNNASYRRNPEEVNQQGRIIWTELKKFEL